MKRFLLAIIIIMIISARILTLRESKDLEQNRGGDTRWLKYAIVTQPPAKEFSLPSQNTFGLVFAVSPDGKKALYADINADLSGRKNLGINIIDLNTGKHIQSIPSRAVQSLAFSNTGETAISGGKNGILKLWSISDGKELKSASGHKSYIRALTYSPTDAKAASGGEDGIILIWDIEKMTILKRLTGHTAPIRHNCLVWSSDGKKILSGSWDGSIRLWDTKTGEQLVHLNPEYGRVMSLALSPNGKRALSSYLDGPDNPCILWDLETKQELHRFGVPGNVWHTSIPGQPWYEKQQLHVQSLAFSSDGKTALFGIIFGTVILWDLDQWQQIELNRLHGKELGFVKYSANGKSSISVGCDHESVEEDAKVKVWHLPEPS